MPGIPSPGGGGAGGFDISSMMGGMMGAPKHSAEAAATARNETEAIVQKMGAPVMGSFKKGGIVPKTGNYKLHEGEAVVPKAKLGSGARFAALKSKLGHQKGIRNPAALAAAIGRKKYGAKKMGQLSAGGR